MYTLSLFFPHISQSHSLTLSFLSHVLSLPSFLCFCLISLYHLLCLFIYLSFFSHFYSISYIYLSFIYLAILYLSPLLIIIVINVYTSHKRYCNKFDIILFALFIIHQISYNTKRLLCNFMSYILL